MTTGNTHVDCVKMGKGKLSINIFFTIVYIRKRINVLLTNSQAMLTARSILYRMKFPSKTPTS